MAELEFSTPKTLDKIIEREFTVPPVIKTSVGKIIDELFHATRKYKSFEHPRGGVYHYKLGFMNAEKYSRYLPLDSFGLEGKYMLISGVPDNVSYENGQLFVDELKTTITGRESYVRKVGLAQLQLYMFITGIPRGRLFIYYKDKNELVLDRVVSFDKEEFSKIISKYVTILLARYSCR